MEPIEYINLKASTWPLLVSETLFSLCFANNNIIKACLFDLYEYYYYYMIYVNEIIICKYEFMLF